MAKEELFENKAVGWWLRHVNCFPVKREAGDKAAIEEALKRLKQGKAVLIFPEGTRTQDGDLQPFQEGVGFLSCVAHVPVLPVYINTCFIGGIFRKHDIGIGRICCIKITHIMYIEAIVQPCAFRGQ